MRAGSSTRMVVACLAGVLTLLCLVCAALTFRYRRRPILRMSSYRVSSVSIVGGLALSACSVVPLYPVTPGSCIATLWLTMCGSTLLFGPMVAKLWRIYCLFCADVAILKRKRVTDAGLFRVVGALFAVDLALLAAQQATAPYRVDSEDVGEPTVTEDPAVHTVAVHQRCAETNGEVVMSLMLAWKIAEVVAGSVLAFRSRGVNVRALNDSKWVGMSVYTTAVVACIAVPAIFVASSSAGPASTIAAATRAVGIFLSVGSALSLAFFPKFIAIWRKKDAAWVAVPLAHAKSSKSPGHTPRSPRSRSQVGAPPDVSEGARHAGVSTKHAPPARAQSAWSSGGHGVNAGPRAVASLAVSGTDQAGAPATPSHGEREASLPRAAARAAPPPAALRLPPLAARP